MSDEDEEEFEDVRPGSPLIQQFPQEHLWLTAPSVSQKRRCEQIFMEGSSCEESATSTFGISSSTKRSREENWEQVSTKPRRLCEGDLRDTDPSTSTSGSSAKRRELGARYCYEAEEEQHRKPSGGRTVIHPLLASDPPQTGAGSTLGGYCPEIPELVGC